MQFPVIRQGAAKFLHPAMISTDNKTMTEHEQVRTDNQAPGWLDFILCYQELEKLKESASHNTHKLVAAVKKCHDYIMSLTDYEYQYVYAIPAFAERFDRVENLYAKIEAIIRETVDSIVGTKGRQ